MPTGLSEAASSAASGHLQTKYCERSLAGAAYRSSDLCHYSCLMSFTWPTESLCIARDWWIKRAERIPQCASIYPYQGLLVCPGGSTRGVSRITNPAPNTTTEVTVHTRQVSVIAARSNYSNASITETSFHKSLLHKYPWKSSISRLIKILFDGCSTIQQLTCPIVFGCLELLDWVEIAKRSAIHELTAQSFQSVLALPFWLLNSTNWETLSCRRTRLSFLCLLDFYATAYRVAPCVKIKFDFTTFVMFLFFSLQSSAMAFALEVMIWVWSRSTVPLKTSNFPLHNIWVKVEVRRVHEAEGQMAAKDSEVVKEMKEA
ncbi:hypothetical protein BKA67DRAFT_644058 [Truncatella angustata]|uniref:Uncharacterized protein n=1 Tax=Truncatella angustata TaxID=152316 RepID=A0A9P9A1C5_9PEZI|nr:uncharacterized protein BKA67DRAFT_644058 [Truncatella angustata]KAH6658188.1 hypothetical protein BKA67DRAFT_644058 [Truncatella angustata]